MKIYDYSMQGGKYLRENLCMMVIPLLILPTFILTNPALDPTTSIDIQIPEMPNKRLLSENANKLLATAPSVFTENRGQLENDDVRFYAQGNEVWFTDDGVWFELREEVPVKSRESRVECRVSRLPTDDWPLLTREYKRLILKQEFKGSNHVLPEGRKTMEHYSNFFYGNDSSKWRTKVPSYQEIYYKNIYDSIDLRYYHNKNNLKYDFIVYPGADIDQIKIKLIGADGLEVDQLGNIVIKTSIEDLIDYKPIIYQHYNNRRHYIDGNFKILNNLEYGFELSGNYNAQEFLVIDPTIVLEYSTFLGDESYCDAIAVDNNGSAIVTGSTESSTFPTTPGAFDTSYNGPQGFRDIFVTKFNPKGSALIFSTYIGGKSPNYVDWARDITVDTDGNIFLTGLTYCSDYPTTPGAFNTSKSGLLNECDVFVTKLSADGTKLLYSTFIGSGPFITNEEGYSIAIDAHGNAYVTGYTYSWDFPTTPGAYDTSFNGGYDVFILKLNHTGATLDYSTFIGGTAVDFGTGITIDSTGSAYATGNTYSSDFPTTAGVYDTSGNGRYDVFVLKLNSNGSNLMFSTFIGGNEDESSSDIVLNNYGDILITGWTESLNFPTTKNAISKTYNGGSYDIIVAILNKTGTSLNYSTYLGGNNSDFGSHIAANSFGEIYITGFSNSSNFPTTYDAFNNSSNTNDMILFQLSQNGSELMYSTFICNSMGGFEISVATDILDNVYIAGHTGSPGFPTTPGAYDTSFNGAISYGNVFVMKWFRNRIHSISSVSLKMDNLYVSKVYSKLCTYTFNVNLNNTISSVDLKTVRIILSPLGKNIQLKWDRPTGLFSKLNDPNNYVTLESSSKVYNKFWDKWSIDFNVTFNWIYPDEELQDVNVIATSATLTPTWFNVSKMYNVENDLVFNGTLEVKTEDNRFLDSNDLVKGGEVLNWTGLRVIYEETKDLFPLEDEFNITIWDESGDCWETSPGLGEFFNVQTIVESFTDLDGDLHIINITGIPPECDGTNDSFIVKIDSENVTFSNPRPYNSTWHRDTTINVGITITDHGGGLVDGKNIMYKTSTDNGTSWENWVFAPEVISDLIIEMETMVAFKNGKDNLIQWCAFDTVGNGPAESIPYRVLVDTEDLIFSEPWPLIINRSSLENVNVGITISDNISGINAKTIEFSISENGGMTWGPWTAVGGFDNGKIVDVILNLTLHNRTENRIRWRASDIAGNGPTKSKAYIINVMKPEPKTRLIAPANGSVINTTKVMLVWELDEEIEGIVTYKILFGPSYPPSNDYLVSDLKTYYEIEGLSDNITYYWKVNIIIDGIKKYPSNEIWWFKVKLEPVDKEKIYDIEIDGTEFLSLYPGGNESIELSITNLGNFEDDIKLEILPGKLSLYITLNNNSTMVLGSKKTGLRVLIIRVPVIISPGNYSINILAISLNSGGKETDSHIINLEIKELIIPVTNDSKPETDKKPNYLIWVLIAIIIIIILIIIFAIIIKRKEHKTKTVEFKEQSVTVKPSQPQSQAITTDKQLKTPSFPQLPEVTTTSNTQQPTLSIVPQLAKSTEISQKSDKTPQAQIPQLPQLPPAVQSKPQSRVSTTPITFQTTNIMPEPKVELPGEQSPQPTPTPAFIESSTQNQKSPTLAKPEIATKDVNEKSQPSE